MDAQVVAGKYRIIREIARSNDVVYEAVDNMGRRVAVKELLLAPNLAGADRRDRIERFNREARSAGRLSHHNIVTIHDCGEDDGLYYIAMEYLEGITLRQKIAAEGALPLRAAITIASQVLSGLEHAHANGVIHRDVKPENIHVLPDGHIKLTDFGIARILDEASMTQQGQAMGTPSYMSPEQIAGGAVDLRTDIFSTGIVLYEMLAGRKPFSGDSISSMTYSIVTADPPPLLGIPVQLEQIARQALAKDPAARFPSAAAMRLALATVTDDPGTLRTSGIPAQPTAAGPAYLGQTVMVPQHAAQPPPPFANPFEQAQPSVAPAFARPPVSTELIVLRTILAILVLGSAAYGGLQLFSRASQNGQATAASQEIERLLRIGTNAANGKDYDRALGPLGDAYGRSTGGLHEAARTTLAKVQNMAGERAFRAGDLAGSTALYQKTLALYPAGAAGLGAEDLKALGDAQESLRIIAAQSPGGRLPAVQATDTNSPRRANSAVPSVEQKQAEAHRLLLQGIDFYDTGNRAQARECWTQVVALAPGSEDAAKAQQYLDN